MSILKWFNIEPVQSVQKELLSSVETDTMEVVKSSYPKIVQEIHNEFMTAGDMLLEKANFIISNTVVNNREKTKKLSELGFINTKEVVETQDVLARKQQQLDIAEAISDFKIKYPNYKFISEEVAKKICEKYNLVLGDVSQYKGFVPQKNINEIDRFFELYSDEKIEYCRSVAYSMWGDPVKITKSSYESLMSAQNNTMQHTFHLYTRPAKLNICAPIKDMNTEGYTKKGHLLVKDIPDPIVLKPVEFKQVKGFIILTAWGDEASDELVVNQALN